MCYKLIKRIFDVIIGLIALPFVVIVIICCAPMIYLHDRGPIFYNATRAGKQYRPFTMFKLRTMYINSPDIKNPDGSTYNSDKDPRVTPVGAFLRKTSLDEIPQFLNVLLGSMSFIGPRPKLYFENYSLDRMTEDYRRSYSVKPGITGFAQAFYRNSITQDEKFHWDAFYANNISFRMDLKIVLQTIKSVIARENINSDQSN
ncbi:MAG: sugar transferase [Bacteroidales bacterium]|nr:sugar transferase [Bacteroidales bacterium]